MITPRSLMIGASTAALVASVAHASFMNPAHWREGTERASAPPRQRQIRPNPLPPAPLTTSAPPAPVGQPTLADGTFTDPTGQETSLNADAPPQNPFFHPFGSNGRSCASCHRQDEDWSITPSAVQALFAQTGGMDPLFRTVDGSNSPNAPVGTLAQRQAAYSELLSKGLIRIGLPVPPTAQFTLTAVNDPYNFASAAQLSLFRRPLPTTNLPFLSTVMFDGRNTAPGQSIESDLMAQAANAITTHEQGMLPPPQQLQQIVAFENANFTAQSLDANAGPLDTAGAAGGPTALTDQMYYPGINNPLGGDPPGSQFDRNVFALYTAWAPPQNTPPGSPPPMTTAAQQSIARGEHLFNTRPFTISNVPGLTDTLGQPNTIGTCTSCHVTPNVGDQSTAVFIDLGLTDPPHQTPDLPVYTMTNKATGEVRTTSDPGRALITGDWNDIGKFKVPTLRGLAGRAPYFHNGSASDINSVIAFYSQRFNIRFTQQEKTDLAAFLRSL